MKLGYLVPEFPGQTHAFFWREIAALRALGVEVDLVSTRRPAREIVCHEWSEEAIRETVYLFPPSAPGLLRAIGRLLTGRTGACLRAVREARGVGIGGRLRLTALIPIGASLGALGARRGWDHIHVHSCADAGAIAMFTSLLTAIPYSLTLHGDLAGYGPAQNVKWGHATFGVVVAEHLTGQVLAAAPDFPVGRLAVAPMGVDAGRFTRERPYEAADVGGPVRLVSCGRLHPGKGHGDLIEAVVRLRRDGLDAHLTVLGEGPARGELESLVAEKRLGGYVRLPGAASEKRVRSALEESHVFVLASHDEAVGVATMEAMAMGLPVVATRVGGVPGLVRDGVDGVLVPARDPDALAHAIGGLARDPARARAMGVSGAERVRQRFHSGISAGVLAARLAGVSTGVRRGSGSVVLPGRPEATVPR